MLNGNLVSRTTCGETTTGLLLTLDCKYLISTSIDGCIYFWKLDLSFTKNLVQWYKELGIFVPELDSPVWGFQMPEMLLPIKDKISSNEKVIEKAKPFK